MVKNFFFLSLIMIMAMGELWGQEQRLVVLLQKKATPKEIQEIGKIPSIAQFSLFTPYRSDYFSRLYSLKIKEGKDVDWTAMRKIVQVEKIEKPEEIRSFSIRPSSLARPVSLDPLVGFQWALKSNGQQIILPNGSSIDSEYIHSVEGADLKGEGILKELEKKLKRDMVIAIIDFGIDYNHPDLVDGIAYNPPECDLDSTGQKYKNPFRPKKDLDGNGYKGDCLGWNFTEPENGRNHHKPMDNVGHGTHVAGLIAARRDNKIGIAGVSNRLLVLPVKVMHRRQGPHEKEGSTFTDRVAKGILYAITRNVDVINLSLGWPSSLDLLHVKEAIAEAVKKGIVVVAASGNNKNNRPLAPCSYSGVICVGSSRIDKKVSSFSNFGAHVDLLAPGDQILSLFPRSAHNKDKANLFNLPGYEIKSGTSQAAPLVAASTALLKGALGADTDEIKARLFAGSKSLADETKYFRDGLIDLEKSYRLTQKAVIRPEFKNLELVSVHSITGRFSFSLKIKNYWTRSDSFTFRVEPESDLIKLDRETFIISPLGKGEEREIILTGKVESKSISHLAKFKVTIDHLGEERVYPFEFSLAQKWESQAGLQKIPLELDEESSKILDKGEKTGIFPLRTISDFQGEGQASEYYLALQTEEGMKFKIFQKQGNSYLLVKEFIVPSAKILMSFHRYDFEGDAKAEYVIRTGHENQNKEAIVSYLFLDNLFNPYYGSRHSLWTFNVAKNDHVVFKEKLHQLQFLSFPVPTQNPWGKSKVWIPLFIQESPMPHVDQDHSFFALKVKSKEYRLNLLIPEISREGNVEIKRRVFANHEVRKKLAQDMNKKWRDNLVFYSLLLPPEGKSSVRVLSGVIKSNSTHYYVLHLSGKKLPRESDFEFIDYGIQPLKNSNLQLDFNQIYSSINISQDSYKLHYNDVFYAPFSSRMARIALLDSESATIKKVSLVKQKNFQEKIYRFIQSYEIGETFYTFLESNNFLTLLTDSPGILETKITTAPLARFSFVPSHLASEIVRPLVAKEGETWRPALYVDSSTITSRHVYTWILRESELISPLHLSFALPDSCQSRDLSPLGQGLGFAAVFICQDTKGKWWLQSLPLGYRYE